MAATTLSPIAECGSSLSANAANEGAVSSASDGATVTLKQGWLHKLSYRGKGWKKRYVEITAGCELRYGRLIRSTGGRGSTTAYELKGVISLEDSDVVEVRASQLRVDGHEDRFPFIFKVSSQRRGRFSDGEIFGPECLVLCSASVKHGQWWIMRDYYFAAIDEPELASWLDTFKNVCTSSDVEVVEGGSGSGWTSLLGVEGQYAFIQAKDIVPLSRQIMISTQSNVAHATRKLAEGMQSLFRHMVDGPPPMPPSTEPRDARTAAWVLGSCYDTGPDSPRGSSGGGGIVANGAVGGGGGGCSPVARAQRGFLLDVRSRLWFTYRTGFKCIAPSRLTSDAGWGCMLRSGQMMLAQALLTHYLRRDWRLQRDRPPPSRYVEILRWFEDADRPSAPFSIHRIAQAGQNFDRQIGQWFGPDTVCRVLRSLWQSAYTTDGTGPCKTAGYLMAEDRCIYRDLAQEAATFRPAYPGAGPRMAAAREPCPWRSLVVVAPVRLGMQGQLNPEYLPRLAAYLRFPQSLGFVGGRPRHSYYFIGVRGYQSYYLDPHTTQPYRPLDRSVGCASFHCAQPEAMSLAHIDPSLALGFYCDDKSDFDDLCRRIALLASGDPSPILTVADRAPDYLTVDVLDMDVDANDDDVVIG